MTIESKARVYRGDRITVSFDARRCIHAARCVHGLPSVFDPDRRPWIDPDGAEPQAVAAAVRACPTGALRYEPAAGVEAESPAERNTVTIAADGPLYLRGDLVFADGDGEEVRQTRVALCRCGASSNKPFCDNSHEEAGFAAGDDAGQAKLAPLEGDGGSLRVSAAANGPLLLEGPMEILDGAGETVVVGRKGALCRCGASASKPLCDGSHVAIGFEADSLG